MGTCTQCGTSCAGGICAGCSEPAEWAAAMNMIYASPYREHGAWYGPRTAGAAHRVLEEYETERYGAINSQALYDYREDAHAAKRVATRDAPRYDALRFESRITALCHSMGERELQCAMLFWRSRMSYGRIAAEMGVKESTVREWVRRTRERWGYSRCSTVTLPVPTARANSSGGGACALTQCVPVLAKQTSMQPLLQACGHR